MANKIVMATSMMRVWLAVVVKVIIVRELLSKGKLRQGGGWLKDVET